MLMLSFLLVAVVALILGAAVPGVWAQDDDDDDDDGPIVLDDSTIIIETNFTDGDAGIQIFLDGEAWSKIQIKDPNRKKIFDVKGKGKLKKFGLTELFLESEEPNYLEVGEDAITLQEILDLFPEGDYEFKGKTVEKDEITGTATLSHVLPCAPDAMTLSPFREIVAVGAVPIDWEPVTTVVNNDTGTDCIAGAPNVTTYQVIVENLDTEDEFSIFLPDTETLVTVPSEFIVDGTDYKYEVLAISANGNQTIVETWFCVDSGGVPGTLCADPDPD